MSIMKFQILKKEFKDNTIGDTIYKMLEYFATINEERVEKNKQNKNKEELFQILNDLAIYVEGGLRKKFSENFIILINEHPSYAVKYERNYLLGVKYLNFEILVLKSPFICIPGRFIKSLKTAESEKIAQFYEENREVIKTDHLQTIAYQNKYYHTVHSNDKKTLKLQTFNDDFIKNAIVKNISYYNLTAASEKDLSKLALGIQHDLSNEDRDYNWCVVTSKKQLYTESLIKSSDVFYHCKITDDNKTLNINGLRDTEILIYKRFAVFESILKNIVTGKFYEVELKHLVILASVIVFFTLLGVCKRDYTDIDRSTLSFFETKVCLNKSSIISSIALLFIFAVIFGFVKKKMEVNKLRKKRVADASGENTEKSGGKTNTKTKKNQ